MESVTEEGVLIREQGIVPTGWASVLLLEPRLDTLRERGRRERRRGRREGERRRRGGVNYYLAIHYVCMFFSSEFHTWLYSKSMATHESTRVSGIHILITYHTRPLVSVLRCRVNRGQGLGHGGGGQLGAWFDL